MPPAAIRRMVSSAAQARISYRAPRGTHLLRGHALLRLQLLLRRTQVVARVPTSSDKRRLLYLFNKTSNNMNQLAHAANAAELAGTATPATYAGILAELQAIADAMREAVEHAD